MCINKFKTAALLTAALVGVLSGASIAKANSIQISGVTTTLTAGVWDYAYSMSLTANNSLSATNPNGSSLFIFYDVNALTGAKASFAAGTTAASDWNLVFENTSGSWANGLSSIVSQGGTAVETDLAAIPNVRFQFVGSDFSAGAGTSALGTAHLFSTEAPGLYGQFAARWVGLTGLSGGQTQVNTQTILLPTVPSTNVVPLPPAVWTGLTSLIGLALFARARRRAQA